MQTDFEMADGLAQHLNAQLQELARLKDFLEQRDRPLLREVERAAKTAADEEGALAHLESEMATTAVHLDELNKRIHGLRDGLSSWQRIFARSVEPVLLACSLWWCIISTSLITSTQAHLSVWFQGVGFLVGLIGARALRLWRP